VVVVNLMVCGLFGDDKVVFDSMRTCWSRVNGMQLRSWGGFVVDVIFM
jgi:hypothetical protein